MRAVASPTSAAAVRASKSSGICGTQTEASPASSAQRASAKALDLGAVTARSGPIIRPMRIEEGVPSVNVRTDAGTQPTSWRRSSTTGVAAGNDPVTPELRSRVRDHRDAVHHGGRVATEEGQRVGLLQVEGSMPISPR